jgi:hypothetical protein
MGCQDCPKPVGIVKSPLQIQIKKNQTNNLDNIIVECVNNHKILGVSFTTNPKIGDNNCSYFNICTSQFKKSESLCDACSGYSLKGKLIIICPLCNKKTTVVLVKDVEKIFPFADDAYILYVKSIQPIDEKIIIELIIQELG